MSLLYYVCATVINKIHSSHSCHFLTPSSLAYWATYRCRHMTFHLFLRSIDWRYNHTARTIRWSERTFSIKSSDEPIATWHTWKRHNLANLPTSNICPSIISNWKVTNRKAWWSLRHSEVHNRSRLLQIINHKLWAVLCMRQRPHMKIEVLLVFLIAAM